MLDYTCHDDGGSCKFHGHVVEWKNLEPKAQTALYKAGMVKSIKGNKIKLT